MVKNQQSLKLGAPSENQRSPGFLSKVSVCEEDLVQEHSDLETFFMKDPSPEELPISSKACLHDPTFSYGWLETFSVRGGEFFLQDLLTLSCF